MALETLVTRSQSDVMDAMIESASILAAGSDGLLQVYAPDRFDYQSLLPVREHFVVDGQLRRSVAEVNSIAGAIDKRYRKLPAVIDDYDQRSGVFAQIEGQLKAGDNVGLGMEHSELIDIALGLVAVSNRNRQHGIQHRSVLVASKAIDFLGVNIEALDVPMDFAKDFLDDSGVVVEADNTVPVRNFMSIANDATYLTVPDSKTFSEIRGRQSRSIAVFNGHAVRALRANMSAGGHDGSSPILLGVALPGTTVKNLDIGAMDKEARQSYGVELGQEVDLIGQISPSVTKFMSDALTYAIAIRLNDGLPRVEVDKDFIRLESVVDIRGIASKMIKLAERLEPGKKFIYDQTGDLPVVRR